MKLWVIKRTTELKWDSFIGAVVRAENEDEARKLFSEEMFCDYEIEGLIYKSYNLPSFEVKELSPSGGKEVILTAFNAG